MKVLSIRLDNEIYEQVSRLARQERRSVNAQINRMLELDCSLDSKINIDALAALIAKKIICSTAELEDEDAD